jgi:hypothetical protein
MTGVKWNIGDGYTNTTPGNYITWNFQRAPGFFDEVCYTGTGTSPMAVNHNLGVAPNMMIIKAKNSGGYVNQPWSVMVPSLISDGYGGTGNLVLNATDAYNVTGWSAPIATATQITIPSNYFTVNYSGYNYVAYLFATLAGVSKVGTYTGTGGTQTINCGFGAGGARWLMVKRTDSTGNWYVFDSARGFTSSSSPYLLMNSNAAEVTGNNGCYAASTGFTVTSTANATVNINGASYIFLAIA